MSKKRINEILQIYAEFHKRKGRTIKFVRIDQFFNSLQSFEARAAKQGATHVRHQIAFSINEIDPINSEWVKLFENFEDGSWMVKRQNCEMLDRYDSEAIARQWLDQQGFFELAPESELTEQEQEAFGIWPGPEPFIGD